MATHVDPLRTELYSALSESLCGQEYGQCTVLGATVGTESHETCLAALRQTIVQQGAHTDRLVSAVEEAIAIDVDPLRAELYSALSRSLCRHVHGLCTVVDAAPMDQKKVCLALLDRILAKQADYSDRLISAMGEAVVAPIEPVRAKLCCALIESLRGELQGLPLLVSGENLHRHTKCLDELKRTLEKQAAQTERLGSTTVAGVDSSGNEIRCLGLWYDHTSRSFCCGRAWEAAGPNSRLAAKQGPVNGGQPWSILLSEVLNAEMAAKLGEQGFADLAHDAFRILQDKAALRTGPAVTETTTAEPKKVATKKRKTTVTRFPVPSDAVADTKDAAKKRPEMKGDQPEPVKPLPNGDGRTACCTVMLGGSSAAVDGAVVWGSALAIAAVHTVWTCAETSAADVGKCSDELKKASRDMVRGLCSNANTILTVDHDVETNGFPNLTTQSEATRDWVVIKSLLCKNTRMPLRNGECTLEGRTMDTIKHAAQSSVLLFNWMASTPLSVNPAQTTATVPCYDKCNYMQLQLEGDPEFRDKWTMDISTEPVRARAVAMRFKFPSGELWEGAFPRNSTNAVWFARDADVKVVTSKFVVTRLGLNTSSRSHNRGLELHLTLSTQRRSVTLEPARADPAVVRCVTGQGFTPQHASPSAPRPIPPVGAKRKHDDSASGAQPVSGLSPQPVPPPSLPPPRPKVLGIPALVHPPPPPAPGRKHQKGATQPRSPRSLLDEAVKSAFDSLGPIDGEASAARKERQSRLRRFKCDVFALATTRVRESELPISTAVCFRDLVGPLDAYITKLRAGNQDLTIDDTECKLHTHILQGMERWIRPGSAVSQAPGCERLSAAFTDNSGLTANTRFCRSLTQAEEDIARKEQREQEFCDEVGLKGLGADPGVNVLYTTHALSSGESAQFGVGFVAYMRRSHGTKIRRARAALDGLPATATAESRLAAEQTVKRVEHTAARRSRAMELTCAAGLGAGDILHLPDFKVAQGRRMGRSVRQGQRFFSYARTRDRLLRSSDAGRGAYTRIGGERFSTADCPNCGTYNPSVGASQGHSCKINCHGGGRTWARDPGSARTITARNTAQCFRAWNVRGSDLSHSPPIVVWISSSVSVAF